MVRNRRHWGRSQRFGQAEMPEPVVRMIARLFFGTGVAIGLLSALLLALSLGGKAHSNGYAWGSVQIIGLFVISALLGVVFVGWEIRAPEPILPMRLFHNKVFTLANAVGFILGFTMFGAIVFLPLFLQVVTGASATNSGLLLLPLMAGLMTTSILSGRVIARTGRYRKWLIAGMGTAAVGMYLLSTMDPVTSRLASSLYMVVVGLGLGMVMQVLVLAVQNAAEFKDLGDNKK